VAGSKVHAGADLPKARRQLFVGQRSEQRIDVAVVRHVVAEVLHGRGEHGRQPERVDAEPGEMVEPGAETHEIAHAVAVPVGERARVDLVDDGGLPPCSRTAVFMSIFGSTAPAGAVYGFPYALSGTIETWS
jgi:hypothetical protein